MSDVRTNSEEESNRKGGESLWLRLLYSIVLLIVFALAETVLWVLTAIQILWSALNQGRNERVARFGEALGDWTRAATRYLTGASAQKPFPWSET